MARRRQTVEEVVRYWYADQSNRDPDDPEVEAYHEGFLDALRVVAKAADIVLSHSADDRSET